MLFFIVLKVFFVINIQFINNDVKNIKNRKNPLNFVISSKERINVKGENGTGKSTLAKLIIGELEPKHGKIFRADFKYVYIDQDYSLIRNDCTIYEQAQQYNDGALQEHEIKIRLHRYLFDKEYWNKPCHVLSGGEKMRLMLCCLMIQNHAPDIFMLDEPTNNLDIRNIKILTKAINEYKGTVIVISHDSYFLNEIMVNKFIEIS
jgi:ATPase subunit of ABC transporter with duplicated ATPase domains